MNPQRKLILLTLVFLAIVTSSRQQTVNADSLSKLDHLLVTENVELLRTNQHLGIDSILSPSVQKQFVRGKKQSTVYLFFDPYYYWFRIVVRNDQSSPRELAFIMPPFGLKDGKLFQKKDNGWKLVARTGYMYPFTGRSYQYAHFAFPFTISPHTVDTLYFDVDASKAYKSYAFALIDQKPLKEFKSKFYFLFGIIIGLLGLFCLLNVYLNFIYEDRIHLWYAFYIAILMLIVMKHDQLDHQFFGWDSEQSYRLVSTVGISAIAIGTLMHVVQSFLAVVIRRTAFYWILVILKYIVLFGGITQLIVFYLTPEYHIQNFVWTWAIWGIRIGILAIIINCIYSIAKGYKLAIFILVGLIVFLIGSLERILLISSSSYIFPPTLFHIGMVIEVLIISFGLTYRYRIERKKKSMYELEKIKLRNDFDEELLRTRIAIQEETIKSSFKEINNNIGKAISQVQANIEHLKSAGNNNQQNYLGMSKSLLVNTIADLRNLCKTLDTDYVMDMGLKRSIEHELEQRKRSGVNNVQLRISGNEFRVDPQKELILFRMYQQLVNGFVELDHAALNVSIKFETSQLDMSFNAKIHNKKQSKTVAAAELLFHYEEMCNLANMIGASIQKQAKEEEIAITVKLPVLEPQNVPKQIE